MRAAEHNTRGILLAVFGSAFAVFIIVGTSECTTRNSASDGALGAGGDTINVAIDTGGAAGSASGAGTGGSDWLVPPPVPEVLMPPTGTTVAAHFHGIGAQIYSCGPSAVGGGPGAGVGGAGGTGGAGGGTTYAWTLKAPDAQLIDAKGAQVGTHTMGPTWTSSVDGSTVVGKKVAQVDAPLAGAIPWLLLQAASNSGSGVFSAITYVQRVNTVGGTAPATTCAPSSQGTETSVDYSADYYFYQ